MSISVDFEPTKKLFIEVLTKDINVHDSILDLVDNAVDAYLRNKLNDKRKIEINFDVNDFIIKDNCGGISKSDVEKEIFRFGKSKENLKASTIGFYGIGLKRSLFKIGERIIFETDDGVDYCKLDIDVDDWVNKEEWILEGDTRKSIVRNKQKGFTNIHILELKEDVKELFDTTFINNFKQTLSIYYTLFLKKKIQILVNGNTIKPYPLNINIEEDANPANYIGEIEGVKVRIICWIQPKTGKREERMRGNFGWNVFMNERLVIHDDASEDTGWTGGENDGLLPKMHPRYYEFRGLVFLKTNTPSKLPINTTKTNFNKESMIYKHLLKKMVDTAKPIVKYLNEKYKKLDENESIEIMKQEEEKKKIKLIPIESLRSKQVFTPPKKTSKASRYTTINYQKQKDRVEKIKKYLDVRSNSELGSKTFEYFWKSEGLDEE